MKSGHRLLATNGGNDCSFVYYNATYLLSLFPTRTSFRNINSFVEMLQSNMSDNNKNVKKGLLRFSALAVAAGLLAMVFPTIASVQPQQAYAGNGAPSGPHYNLNIIGVPKEKDASMTGNNGHRIFVPLEGNCRINLSMGDFQVTDGNCTDGSAAGFQLPNPDPDNDGVTTYSVFARALGKPGGNSTTTTCFDDAQTGETYCSVYSMVLVREKGGSKFTNVSKQLLYVYVDTDLNGQLERYPLFSDRMDDYFWDYTNEGLKLAQLRFYEIPSTCPDANAPAGDECVLN